MASVHCAPREIPRRVRGVGANKSPIRDTGEGGGANKSPIRDTGEDPKSGGGANKSPIRDTGEKHRGTPWATPTYPTLVGNQRAAARVDRAAETTTRHAHFPPKCPNFSPPKKPKSAQFFLDGQRSLRPS